jgi:hypothetical protein
MPSPLGLFASFFSFCAAHSRKKTGNGKQSLVRAAARAVEQLEDRICLSAGVTPTFLPAQFHGSSAATITSADLNGDGKPDLITLSPSGNVVRVVLNAGDGTFLPPQDLNVTDPRSLAVADFNGDGIPDIAVTSLDGNSSRILVYYGIGGGNFDAPVRYAVDVPTVFLAAADLNGDGRPDLIFTSTQRVSVLLNLGGEQFSKRVTYKAGADEARMLIAGDFNNDGVPDIAVLRTRNAVDILLGQKDAAGNPTGTLGLPIAFDAGQNPVGLATGDFNHDGKLDLAIVNSGFRVSSMGVLLGNGDGTFAPRESYFNGNFVDGVTTADFNGDGNLDIATVSFTSGMRIYNGNGDGTFAPPTTFNGGNPGLFVTAADYNGDGRIDAAVATGADFRVLLNSTGTTPTPVTPTTFDVTLGSGGAKSITYSDISGTPATISLAGPGSATVHFAGTGLSLNDTGTLLGGGSAAITAINATGTTTKSALTIKVGSPNGVVSVGSISTDGSLGSLTGTRVVLTGDLTVARTARKITLKDLSNGTISIGAPVSPGDVLLLSIVGASNENLTSATPIQTLAAGQWVSPAGGSNSIVAPSIGTLTTTEQFGANLTIGAGGIGTVSVRSIIGGNWVVRGAVGVVRVQRDAMLNLSALSIGSIMIGNQLNSSVVHSAVDIGSVSAAGMANSTIYAGVGPLPAGQRLPASAGDFTIAATIGSVSLARRHGIISFVNSVIAAPTITRASLGTINFNNGGIPMGLAAHSIGSLTGADAATNRSFSLRKPAGTGALAALGINPQDFVIQII